MSTALMRIEQKPPLPYEFSVGFNFGETAPVLVGGTSVKQGKWRNLARRVGDVLGARNPIFRLCSWR